MTALRVLLVEDNPGDALLLGEALRGLSEPAMELVHERALQTALDRAGREPFDVVLLDLSLPDSQGLDTVRRARDGAPHLPLVVLTGAGDEVLGMQALRLGAQEYLIKGQSDAPGLARAIHYAIERKRLEGEREALLAEQVELRRQAEQAAADARRRADELDAVLNGMVLPVMIFDAAGRPVRANPTAIAQLGFDPLTMTVEQLQHLIDLRTPDGQPVDAESLPLAQALRGQSVANRRYRLGTRTGRNLTVLMNASPILAGPTVVGAVVVAQDISERERLLAELEALNQTLERRVDDRTRVAEQRTAQLRHLAAQLSQAEQRERRRLAQLLHDHLQQLLVGARFNLGVLRGRLAEEKQNNQLDQVDQLLVESIDTSRTLAVELFPPILYDAGLAAALDWLGRQMQVKHGLRVCVQTDEAADPDAEDVRVLLFDATRELLLNVIKHAGVAKAEIRQELAHDDQMRVIVRDRGAGFDPTATPSGEDPASGLGLFSIRERLEMVGGRVRIDSTPGEGTAVTLQAPLHSQQAELPGGAVALASAEPPAPPSVPREGIIRVLLVDDHHIVRQGLAGLLEEEPDLEVLGQADDGQSALDLARELRPDVVVMDICMPGMNGIEATRRLAAEMPGLPVIGLSMHQQADMAQAMRDAGAVDYVTKGGPGEDLIAAIRRCARAHKPHHATG